MPGWPPSRTSFPRVPQTPPKVPPKPAHLGPVQKRQLRKESSLPPAPPTPLKRESSFDSVASGGTVGAPPSIRSFRSVSNMSRIPVWSGSQERLAAAASCTNLKEVSQNFIRTEMICPWQPRELGVQMAMRHALPRWQLRDGRGRAMRLGLRAMRSTAMDRNSFRRERARDKNEGRQKC